MKQLVILAAALVLGMDAAAHEPADGACGCSHAHADWRSQWYLGGSILQADLELGQGFNDGSISASSSDEADVGYRVFGGVRFLGYLGLELGYADYGRVERESQSDGSGSFWAAGPVRQALSLSGADLSALVQVPLDGSLRLVGQAGVIRYDAEGEVQGTSQGFGPVSTALTTNDEGILYSARVEFDPWARLRLGLGYSRLEFSSGFEGDLLMNSFGVHAAYLF